MKKMIIYEPAMCCSTGLCGVGVDPELLRISTVIDNLKKNGIEVIRYNLTNAPQEFIKNKEVYQLISKGGKDILPITVVEGKAVITKGYPSNDTIISLLGVPRSYLGEKPKAVINNNVKLKKSNGCGCSDGNCC